MSRQDAHGGRRGWRALIDRLVTRRPAPRPHPPGSASSLFTAGQPPRPSTAPRPPAPRRPTATVRVHDERIETRARSPLHLTPSQAVNLAEHGPGVLREPDPS